MSRQKTRSQRPSGPDCRPHSQVFVEIITGRTWLAKLPRWVRLSLIAVILAVGALFAIACAPALLYLAAVSGASDTKQDARAASVGGVVAVALLLLAVAFSSGASLVGTARTGEFCSMPSRYAGLHCTTYESSPILFVVSIVAFWVIFWLCSAFVVSAIRGFVSRRSDDA